MASNLLWFESLAVVLLWVAREVRSATPKRHPALQVIVLLVFCVLPAACLVHSWAWFAGMFFFDVFQKHWWECVPWLWLACVAAGTVVLCHLGLRKLDGKPAAERWPAVGLRWALAIAVVLLGVSFGIKDMTMQQLLAGIRADAMAELLSLEAPMPAPDENAAFDYERSAEIIGDVDKLPKEFRGSWASLRGEDANSFDPNAPGLRAFLKDKAEALRLLRRGAGKSGYRPSYRRQMPTLFATTDLRLGGWRDGVNLLVLSARVRAAGGDRKGALDDLAAVTAMARHLSCDRNTIELLTAMGVESICCETLQHFADDLNFAAGDIAAARVDTEPFYQRQAESVVRSEAALHMVSLADFYLTGRLMQNGPHIGFLEFVLPLHRVLALPEQLAEARRQSQAYLDLARQPYWQSKDDLAQAVAGDKKKGLMTATAFGSIDRVIEFAAGVDAQRAAAGVAVAACRYRTARNQWPGKIDDLVPEYLVVAPVDPFDGKALRFKSDGDKIVIYSIGPDAVDDGGAAYDRRAKKGDIVFELRK